MTMCMDAYLRMYMFVFEIVNNIFIIATEKQVSVLFFFCFCYIFT